MLTEKDKTFIIKNEFQLQLIFQKKIDDLVQQASTLPRSPERDSALDTVQGIRVWKAELSRMAEIDPPKPDNLI